MHPAPSVILFTSLSGLGFGLLFFLGLGLPAVTGGVAFGMFFMAYALAVGGLLASVFHLGNPKNAIKAFSQWRTSWLSREGIAAVAALIIMGLYALAAIFGLEWRVLGIIGAILSIGTVFTTSMIYNQLKTVPRWNQSLTPTMFLSLSLAGGAVLAGQATLAIVLLLLAGGVLAAHWAIGDRQFHDAGSTIETATGLGFMGSARLFEGPHTGSNYLMKEMVHVVGRKHAVKLRIIAVLLAILVPVLILLTSGSLFAIVLAAIAHVAGVMVSRWLFFAEAEHVVGLYYDKR